MSSKKNYFFVVYVLNDCRNYKRNMGKIWYYNSEALQWKEKYNWIVA